MFRQSLILFFLLSSTGAALAGPDRPPDILDHPHFLKTVVVNDSEEISPPGEGADAIQESADAEFMPTFTPTPTRTPIPKKFEKSSSKTQASRLPQVMTIPNPAWGKKLTFRVMAEGAVDVRIRIYNRTLDPIDELKKSGVKYFDILWNLIYIPEGLYYYQAQVLDKESGKIKNFPVEKFVVLKNPEVKQKPQKTIVKPSPPK